MYDYLDDSAPWIDHVEELTSVFITDGITSVGAGAFLSCPSLSSLCRHRSI